MALPQAVEKAGKLADELHAAAYGTPEQPIVTPPAPPPPPIIAPSPKAENHEPLPTEDSWESRYKVLTGKYNAEVPRLAADNRTLKETVSQLTEKVTALARQNEDAQSRVPVEPLIKPEEVEEFGVPLVDMARRAGKEAVAQANAPFQRDLAQVREELTDLKKSAAEIQWQNFLDLVTQICPEWAQINVNDDFLTWMGGTDELSGMTRQDLLERATRAPPAPRAAPFFQTCKPANQPPPVTSRTAMEQHVVPDSSSRTVVPNGKTFITRSQIKAHYDNVRAGRVSAADEAAIEAEINAATIEGRII